MNTTLTLPKVSSETEFICNRKDTCIYVQGLLQNINSLRFDLEQLERVLEVGVEEFKNRNKRITELEEELKFYKEIEDENKLLKEQLEKEKANVRLLQKMLFSKGAEKHIEEVSEAKNEEVEYEETETGYVVKTTKRGAKNGHKGHGRKIPDNLPVEEEIIDLSEDEKRCEICGKPLEDTGMYEDSTELCVKKLYYIKKRRRKIYKKSCSCDKCPTLKKASLASKLIPKGKFSIEFWVELLINKYMNHMPLTRQISDMKCYGVKVSSGTITKGFEFIYFRYIIVLYNALIIELRKTKLLHADETGYYIFQEIEGKENYNWYMWGFVCDSVILFVLDPTRSAKVLYKTLFNMTPEDIEKLTKNKPLRGNDVKPVYTVIADKYSSYKAVQNQRLIDIANCWAHQKREFEDLLTKYPQQQELKLWVETWLTKISLLYDVNDERVKYNNGGPDFEKYHNKLIKILDWMKQETEKQYTPPQMEVMKSMHEHWKELTLFVEHPEIPLDNNPVERALRPIVLGINNYYGNCSIWGGEFLAAMQSIIQTCLLHGISPKAYLTYYFQECAKRGSAPDEFEIISFLPHKLTEDVKKSLSPQGPT